MYNPSYTISGSVAPNIVLYCYLGNIVCPNRARSRPRSRAPSITNVGDAYEPLWTSCENLTHRSMRLRKRLGGEARLSTPGSCLRIAMKYSCIGLLFSVQLTMILRLRCLKRDIPTSVSNC